MAALANLVDLNCLVALGGHKMLAWVVVVETEDVRLRATVLDIVALEELFVVRNCGAMNFGCLQTSFERRIPNMFRRLVLNLVDFVPSR